MKQPTQRDSPGEVVYLAVGSNLGRRVENIKRAVRELKRRPEIEVEALSSLYRSRPMYHLRQPDFVNYVVRLRTTLSPRELLANCQAIEQVLGREETFPNGPRIVDLDILSFGKIVLDSADLKIPHPRLQERHFVLIPWAELNPGWVHPLLAKSVKRMLAEAGPNPGVRPLK